MPAPVKATRCVPCMIQRAMVVMCWSRRWSCVMMRLLTRLIGAKTVYQAVVLVCTQHSAQAMPLDGRLRAMTSCRYDPPNG
jgi:hypothetical protein